MQSDPKNAVRGLPKYRAALATISARTGTALPSLITSFAILHEVSAIVPLVGVFYAARSLGVGEKVIHAVQASSDVSDSDETPNATGAQRWLNQTGRAWITEGEQWVGRVGRRYGIWGFEKGSSDGTGGIRDCEREGAVMKNMGGDVANAVLAYGATKAMLPLRIGFSLYFSPLFSRTIIDPFSRTVMGMFRR